MEFNLFKKQVSRLKKTYGQDSYPQACIEAIWKQVEHCGDRRFVLAIDRVLSNNVNPKFPPGIDKIEAALSQIREVDNSKKKKSWSEEYRKACGTSSAKSLSNKQVAKSISEILKGLGDAV